MINDPPFRDYHNEIRAERDALREDLHEAREQAELCCAGQDDLRKENDALRTEIERLTRDRDYWQNIRARPAERELAAAERKLAMAVEALRKLAKASARLSVAAQTTGGVAGRDEGLCAEIDRLAQPLGEARATLAEMEKNDG